MIILCYYSVVSTSFMMGKISYMQIGGSDGNMYDSGTDPYQEGGSKSKKRPNPRKPYSIGAYKSRESRPIDKSQEFVMRKRKRRSSSAAAAAAGKDVLAKRHSLAATLKKIASGAQKKSTKAKRKRSNTSKKTAKSLHELYSEVILHGPRAGEKRTKKKKQKGGKGNFGSGAALGMLAATTLPLIASTLQKTLGNKG